MLQAVFVNNNVTLNKIKQRCLRLKFDYQQLQEKQCFTKHCS